MSAYRGELEVAVTSAEPLDKQAMGRLEKALKATQLAEGKTLKIVNRVSGVYSSKIAKLMAGEGEPWSIGRLIGRLRRQDE